MLAGKCFVLGNSVVSLPHNYIIIAENVSLIFFASYTQRFRICKVDTMHVFRVAVGIILASCRWCGPCLL